METYLYLLEIFVETIGFGAGVGKPGAELKESYVVVYGDVGSYLEMEISTLKQPKPSGDTGLLVDFHCGKSCLFPSTPVALLECLKSPLILTVSLDDDIIGECEIPWKSKFIEMVEKCRENPGIRKAENVTDTFLIKEISSKKIKGDVKAYIRLSPFGDNIQTNFQMVKNTTGSHKFLIKGDVGETTFQCQKYGEGSSKDFLPVGPIMGPAGQSNDSGISGPLSWMALFNSNLHPSKASVVPDEFSKAMSKMFGQPVKASKSNQTFDIISIMEKPHEHKFLDIRIRTNSEGLLFELGKMAEESEDEFFQKDRGLGSFFPDQQGQDQVCYDYQGQDDGHFHYRYQGQVQVPGSGPQQEIDELSVEAINRKLCKSKDCPAAKLFKKYGIGPLAVDSGLGGVKIKSEEEPQLPRSYGISQTYGTLDQYGPYGLFLRPKKPDDPFVPKKDSDWSSACWTPSREGGCACDSDPC